MLKPCSQAVVQFACINGSSCSPNFSICSQNSGIFSPAGSRGWSCSVLICIPALSHPQGNQDPGEGGGKIQHGSRSVSTGWVSCWIPSSISPAPILSTKSWIFLLSYSQTIELLSGDGNAGTGCCVWSNAFRSMITPSDHLGDEEIIFLALQNEFLSSWLSWGYSKTGNNFPWEFSHHYVVCCHFEAQ